ncbi:hypothetical protein ACQ86N_36250 [Puia sp. P3]
MHGFVFAVVAGDGGAVFAGGDQPGLDVGEKAGAVGDFTGKEDFG